MPDNDSFAQILADTIAAEAATVAPVEPAVEAAPAVEAPAEPVAETPAEPAVEAAPEPAAPVEKKEPWVALSRHNVVLREHKQAVAENEALRSKIAELEARTMANIAAANPVAAAASAGAENPTQWLEDMLAAGAEIPPEMVENLRAIQTKVLEQDKKLSAVAGFIEQQQEAKGLADFHAGLMRLQERCPQYGVEEMVDWLKGGVTPQQIVGWHDQAFTPRPGTQAAPAAAPAAPKLQPVPQLTSAAPRKPEEPTDDTVGGYLNWFREFTSTQH